MFEFERLSLVVEGAPLPSRCFALVRLTFARGCVLRAFLFVECLTFEVMAFFVVAFTNDAFRFFEAVLCCFVLFVETAILRFEESALREVLVTAFFTAFALEGALTKFAAFRLRRQPVKALRFCFRFLIIGSRATFARFFDAAAVVFFLRALHLDLSASLRFRRKAIVNKVGVRVRARLCYAMNVEFHEGPNHKKHETTCAARVSNITQQNSLQKVK